MLEIFGTFLLGAATTLGASAVLHLAVIPRVDARRRQEERWERDVLALGELMTAELPKAANSTHSDQRIMHVVHFQWKDLTGLDPEKLASTQRELRDKAAESTERYSSIARVRVQWLGDRVVSIAPKSAELIKLASLLRSHNVSAMFCTIYDYPHDDFDEEKFEAAWKSENEKTKELTSFVSELARRRRPPAQPKLIGLKWMRNRFSKRQ